MLMHEELMCAFLKGQRNGNWKKLARIEKAFYRAALSYTMPRHGVRRSIVRDSVVNKLLILIKRLLEAPSQRIFKRGFERAARLIWNHYIVILIAIFTFSTAAIVAQAKVITVCPSGCDYSSIQSAIDAANNGDLIEVYSGNYPENLNVNKQITLQGYDTGDGKPIINGSGQSGNGITVNAEGVLIDGFEIKHWKSIFGGSGRGVVINENNVTIRNCEIWDNTVGIWIESNYNKIYKCKIYANNVGISVVATYGNRIENSSIFINECGISLEGVSSSNFISKNSIYSNGIGIHITAGSGNFIVENDIWENKDGIGFLLAVNSYIAGNYIGLNERGIVISRDNPGGHIIWFNSFLENQEDIWSGQQTFILPNNWNSSKQLIYEYEKNIYCNYLGNYWSGYTGLDENGDGIGDTPYEIRCYDPSLDKYIVIGEDNYPLMQDIISYDLLATVSAPKVFAKADQEIIEAGNKLWGNRIIVNPTSQTLHFRCVNEIRNSTGFLQKSWEVSGYLGAHEIWNKRGYIYIPVWAPSDIYTYTAILYDADTNKELDRCSLSFKVLGLAEKSKIGDWGWY